MTTCWRPTYWISIVSINSHVGIPIPLSECEWTANVLWLSISLYLLIIVLFYRIKHVRSVALIVWCCLIQLLFTDIAISCAKMKFKFKEDSTFGNLLYYFSKIRNMHHFLSVCRIHEGAAPGGLIFPVMLCIIMFRLLGGIICPRSTGTVSPEEITDEMLTVKPHWIFKMM